MKTGQRHQKRLIRAVYPNGSEKRGYHIVSTNQNARPFAGLTWLTKWAGNVMPKTIGLY